MKIKDRSIGLRWLVYLYILVALSAPWMSSYSASYSFVKAYIFTLGILLVSLLMLWKHRLKNTLTLNFNSANAWFLGLFVWGSLSIFWTVNVDFTISKWFLWLAAALTFFIASGIKQTNFNLLKICWGITIGSAIIAAFGVLQYLFDLSLLIQADSVPASTFGNKNTAAQVMVLSFPLSLYLLFADIKGVKLWLLGFSTALIVAFLFYTTTRAAWLGFSLELILISLFLIAHRKKFKQWTNWNSEKTKTTVATLLLILLLVNVSSTGFKSSIQVATDNIGSIADEVGSNQQDANPRYKIWNATINMIKDKPIIGSGLGSFYQNIGNKKYNVGYAHTYQRAHNDWLELGSELGIIGWLLLLGIIVSLITVMYRLLKNLLPQQSWFYYLLLTALAGSALNMMFSFPYQLAMPLMLFAWYSGLIIKAGEPHHRQQIIVLPLSKKSKIFIAGTAISTVLLIGFIHAQWISIYTQIDTFGKKANQPLPTMDMLVFHAEMPAKLRYFGENFFNNKLFETHLKIEKILLDYWQDDLVSLFRSGISLLQLKQYQAALSRVKQLIKVEPKGVYFGEILQISIYDAMGERQKSIEAYNKLAQQPIKLLAKNRKTLLFLHLKSIQLNSTNTLYFYQQINKYQHYRCKAENNMATYYTNLKDYKKAAIHMQQALAGNDRHNLKDKRKKCINRRLLKQLEPHLKAL